MKMDNHYLIPNPDYNVKYRKVKNNRSINNIQRKKIPKKNDMSAYDEIISRAKNTIDIFQKQLEQTIPNIINYENNINNIKNIQSYRNINQPTSNKLGGHKSARILSGSSSYFQPILTDIDNLNKEQAYTQNINESYNINSGVGVDDYYKKLFQKSKNENIKLIKKINELENINFNNERIIMDYKNEKNLLLQRIQELENIINEYENQNNSKNFMDNSSEKIDFYNNINNNEYIFLNNERNKILEENENLKNEINKILQDNNNDKSIFFKLVQ